MKISIRNAVSPLLLTLAAPLITAENPTGCLEQVQEGKDLFPDKVQAESSEFWSISYHNTYKILQNEIDDASYLLYQCGTEPPAEELDGRHDAVISIPPSDGAAVSQTTHIPHLETLGIRTQIKAYLGDPQYISSPCVNQMIQDGDIAVVQNTSDATALTELLASTGSDLVSFVGSFNDPESLNNTILVSAFNEKTNAGVYEWNKYIAAIFNLEARANDLYDEITTNYDCIADNAARVAADKDMQPIVLWAYYSPFYNGWDVGSCPNYYCEYAQICSAELLNSFEGSIEGYQGAKLMTTEEFLAFGKHADHWIFPSADWDTVYADNKETLDQFQSVQNQEVYDYQGSGSNAWFENRLVEYDVVAQDFCEVVGTQDPFHTREWFRNVFSEEVGDPGTCTDVNAPLESRVTECVDVPAPGQSPTSNCTSIGGRVRFLLVAGIMTAVSFFL